MIHYLEIDEVMAIHETMIDLFGGRKDIHDFTLLHSAVKRCKATFAGQDLYPSIFEKAAALIQSLILNHPFDDGNKRTAITSAARFLSLNGLELTLPIQETIDFTLGIDSHKLTFKQTANWFKKHSKFHYRESG
jgi:death on curing protein